MELRLYYVDRSLSRYNMFLNFKKKCQRIIVYYLGLIIIKDSYLTFKIGFLGDKISSHANNYILQKIISIYLHF